jgi:rSAM/selenodomain-associated transferase 2
MPRCSFIIPVLDEAAGISPLLRALRRQYAQAEIIVVDGGSSDGTPELAAPWCDQLLPAGRGRAIQMNLGARAARGDYLFFLHADSLPGVDAAQLQSCLETSPDWGFCRVSLSGQNPAFRVIEGAMNLRSRMTRVATGDQMLFVRASLFRRTGGFAPIPLMEDVEYSKRLRKLARPTVITEPVVTSSRRWESGGIARTVLRMWGLRLAWFFGVSPQRLSRYYYPRLPHASGEERGIGGGTASGRGHA